ncbi:MAG: trypsin-like peptidase domain-containing protein [Chloroflexota bacterium]|nr:trypsin-like peptidase domain-containing protein [Chloroflexota bacterium]
MQSNSSWVLEYHGQEHSIPPQGLRIGRGQDNNVILQDDQVSRRHASVWDAQGVVFIRDEGSTNGTFVNGKRIGGQTPLRPGDRVQIGNTTLSVRLAAGAAVRAEPPPIAPGASTSNQAAVALVVGGVLVIGLLIGCIALIGILANPSPQPPPPPVVAQPATRATAPLAATVLPTFSPVPPTSAPIPSPTAGNVLQRALMATVYIECQVGTSNLAVSGSGSIINAGGLILTNFHVVRDTTTGKPYNNNDRIYVAVNSSPDRTPDRVFRAQVVASDSDLDLALLKLVALEHGESLPADLGLTVIPLGDSDSVHIGDRIQVIGFPGLGGSTLTLTEGTVSGFYPDRTWIKTDTQVNPGNSGGMAINAKGELIGVPTRKRSDTETGGQLGLIRPINLAKPIMAQGK